MPAPVIKVEGAAELRRALRYIGDQGLKDALKDAHKSAAEAVVKRALPNVPVRTGRLRRSVRARGSQQDGRALAGTAAVPYAAAIHWGRKRGGVIKGRPFLWNAARESTSTSEKQFIEKLDVLLDAIRQR